MFLPKNDCVVLSASEYARIRKTAAAKPAAPESPEARRKEELHQRSLERMKGWNDSVMALRERQERRRKEKEEKAEEERLKIDAEEDERKVRERREILEKTKDAFTQQEEIVRAFNSKLMLSEIQAEREAQIDLQKERARQMQILEEQHHQEMLAQIRDHDERAARRNAEDHEKALKLAQDRQEQLQLAIDRARQSYEDKMREGREMQDKFRVQLAMESKAIDNTRGRALQCRQENDRQIDYQRGTATMLEHKTSPCQGNGHHVRTQNLTAHRLREEERQAQQEADEKLAAIERLKEQTVDQIREVAAHQAQLEETRRKQSFEYLASQQKSTAEAEQRALEKALAEQAERDAKDEERRVALRERRKQQTLTVLHAQRLLTLCHWVVGPTGPGIVTSFHPPLGPPSFRQTLTLERAREEEHLAREDEVRQVRELQQQMREEEVAERRAAREKAERVARLQAHQADAARRRQDEQRQEELRAEQAAQEALRARDQESLYSCSPSFPFLIVHGVPSPGGLDVVPRLREYVLGQTEMARTKGRTVVPMVIGLKKFGI
ncbi:hypothetical protein PAPYR_1412 [Paratrimastix pyriformis]|uniref:Trichohyalin-plectin-homology domain-containing protein n=1 Tax=Paratrimastix pyriformis TaxID=342808 RepID=A0ABQ8USV3_9EUKA|nr:hypothetical protein PAPYR_1412 [Paratrimastix pyriformis]